MNPSTVHSLTNMTVYLMGMSFVLGSLSTILILIVLDFIRIARSGGFKNSEDVAAYDESTPDAND